MYFIKCRTFSRVPLNHMGILYHNIVKVIIGCSDIVVQNSSYYPPPPQPPSPKLTKVHNCVCVSLSKKIRPSLFRFVFSLIIYLHASILNKKHGIKCWYVNIEMEPRTCRKWGLIYYIKMMKMW